MANNNEEHVAQKIVTIGFDNEEFRENVEESIAYLEKFEDAVETFEKNINDKAKKISGSLNTLNNLNFSKDIESGLTNINNSIKEIFKNEAFKMLSDQLDEISYRFTILGKASLDTFSSMVQRAMEAGISISKSLSIDNVFAGLSQYNNKNNAMRTIVNSLQGADASIEKVNKQLEDLVTFTDETSYNFQDMITNMGRFTSAGVALEPAAKAMMGIANWSAFVGKNAYEASRAYDVMARSIGQGYMNWIQFQSLSTANFMDPNSRKAFIQAAVDAKKITKIGENSFSTKKGTKFTTENMETTLNEKWLTTDVMASALGSYSKYAEAVIGYSKETGKSVSQVLDIFEKEGVNKLFDEFSIKAFKSAQEAKTFSEALDSVRVAAGAQFSHTFEILFGTVDEAKTMWTELANTLWDVFIPPIQALNGYLEELQEWGVFNDIINSLKNVFGAFLIVVKQVGDAFKNVFPVKSAEDISDITFALREFTRQMLPSKEVLEKFKKIMETIFLFFKKIIDIAKQLAKIISPLVSTVLKKFFDLAYAISSVIYDLLQKIDFDAILNRISFAIETITKVISNFVVPTPDTSAFDAFAKKVEVPFNIIKSIATGLITVLSTVKNFISGILKDIFNGNLFANLNELLKFIRDIFITKLVIDFTFFFNNLIKGTSLALTKLNIILSDFGKGILRTMKEIDNGDMSDSLLKFSGAILMLAFAIRILSSDANTSTGKIVLITGTLLALLAAAVRWASFYTINGKDISDKGKKFSNSLGTFLDSLKKGTKKGKNIFKNTGDMLSVGGMAVARGINDIIFNITNSIDQFLQKKALSNMVIAFSAAIIAIAYSIHKLTSIKTKDIWKIIPALMGLAGGIYAISKAVKFLSKIDGNRDKGFKGLLQSIGNSVELMSKSIAMIALSGAITLLTNSFIKLSQLKLEQIGKGFLGIAGSVAVLAGAIKFLSTTTTMHSKKRPGGWGNFVEEWKKKSNLLSMSVTMLAISAAINNLATSLERLGKLDLPTLGKGIGAIALTMGILVGALKLLSTTTTSHEKENKGKGSFLETFIGKSNLLSMSVAVLSLAGAINILTNSIIRLGEQNIETLAKGLGSIAVILGILVKVLNNIEAVRKQQQESGAGGILSFLLGGFQAIQQLILPVTLIAIAGAIMILIQAIQQLMNMDSMELIFRIIALAGVATILVTTLQSLNEVDSLNLLGISASLLGMAAAFLIFSGAILVLTPALKALTEINFLALIAVMVALAFFTTFLVGIADATGGTAVLALLGIGAGLMLVGAGAILCAMAISILVDALIALLNCLADIIHGCFADILAIFGVQLPRKMEKSGIDSLKGFEKGANNERKDLNNTMKDIANNDVVDSFNKELKIKSPSKLFEESGEFVLKGLNEGLEKKSLRKDIRDTVKDLANEDVSETFNNELGIHSNSDEFIDKGGFIDGGLAEGTTKNKGIVENALESLSNTVIDSFKNNDAIKAAKNSGQEIVSSLSTEIKDGVGGLAKESGIDKMVDDFGKEIKKEIPELEIASNAIGDAITKGADSKNAGKEIKKSVIEEIKKDDSISKEGFQLGKKIGQGMRMGLNSSNWMSVEDFKKYENRLKQLGIKYEYAKEYNNDTGELIREGYHLSNSFDSKKLYEENKKAIDKFTYTVSKLYNSGEGRSFYQGEKLSEEEFNKYKDYIDLLDLKYKEIENYNPLTNTWGPKDYEIEEDFGLSEIVSLLDNIDTNTRDINYLKKLISKGEGREFQEGEIISEADYARYGKFIKNSGVELESYTEKVKIGTGYLTKTEKNINELNNILQPNRFINEKIPSFSNDTNEGKSVFVKIKKYKVKKGILFATKAEYDSYIDEYNRILESEEDADEILKDYDSAGDYAKKMLAKDNKIFVNNGDTDKESDEERKKKEEERKQKEREAKINKDYQGKDINAEIWHELNNIASIYEASGLEKSKAMQKATEDTLGYYNALLKVSKEEDENYDKNLTQNAALAKVRAESLADYKNTLQQQYNNNKFGLNSVEATTANIDYATAKNNIKMQKQKIENFMNGFKRLANAGLSAELANVIKNEGYWNSSTFAMLNNMSDKEIQRYQDAIKEFDEYFINAQSLISSTHLAIDVKQHYKNETDKKKKELDDQVDIDTNMLKASGWTSEDIKKHIEQKYKEAYKNLGIDKNFTVETPKPGTITIKSSNPDIKIDNKNKSAEEEIQNKSTTVSGHSGTDSSSQIASKDPNKDEKNRIENSSLYNTIEGWIDEYTNADIEEKDVRRLIRIAARKDYDKDQVRELFENEGYSWEEDEIPEDGEEEVYYSKASKASIESGSNGEDSPGVIWSNKQMHQGETKAESQGEQMGGSFVEGLSNTLDEQGPTIIQNTADQAEPIIQDSFLNILNNLIQNPEFMEKCIEIGNMISKGISVGIGEGSDGANEAGQDLGESVTNAVGDGSGVASPSKITTKIGRYIAEGLANGIRQNTFLGTDAAYTMAADTTDVFRNAFSNINSMVDDELNNDWNITPVVNLDNVKDSAEDMKDIFTNKDLEMIARVKSSQNEGKNSVNPQQNSQPNNFVFTQNNYSPKSLSRLDIYRQTNNQFSQIKTILDKK